MDQALERFPPKRNEVSETWTNRRISKLDVSQNEETFVIFTQNILLYGQISYKFNCGLSPNNFYDICTKWELLVLNGTHCLDKDPSPSCEVLDSYQYLCIIHLARYYYLF